MYRRILVPVDGSPTAARGLREAIRLAKQGRSRVRIIHVVDESALVGLTEAGGDEIERFLRRLTERGRAVLRKARDLAMRQGVQAETSLQESLSGAAKQVLAEAARWRADLIVMGTHGRRGVRRLVLGSDAEQVVRSTSVPVLLVRS